MIGTPNFDGLAGVYRWMEYFSFGPWLALTRRTFINELGPYRHALVIGDGDGRFTARLLRTNPQVRVEEVDASGAMLNRLLQRAGSNRNRVTIHRADARSWEPTAAVRPYDLVVTHFFLDCLTGLEVEDLATKLRKYISPGGVWVVSEFAVPAGGFGRFMAAPLISFLYWCFGWMTELNVRTLPDYRKALMSAGFTRVRTRLRLGGILTAELWAVTSKETRGVIP